MIKLASLSYFFFFAFHATAADLDTALNNAFGPGAQTQKQFLAAHTLADKPGLRPEDVLKSGDVIVYLDVPPTPQQAKELADANIPDLPPVFHNALQGFEHAAIVARKKSGQLFHLDSPMDKICGGDFRGSRPYVVLHPSKKIAEQKKFQDNVDALVRQFSKIGYQYDAGFDTEILDMSPSERGKLHAAIMSYNSRSDQPKPEIPKMYCSELVVTIYALLGIFPHVQVSGEDLVREGLKQELASGKPKEQVASEAANGMIDTFSKQYSYEKSVYMNYLEHLSDYKIPQTSAPLIRAKIAEDEKLVRDIESKRPILNNFFSSEVGCELKSKGSSILMSSLEALAFYFANRKSVVRPIDLIRETASENANFTLAGYYDGSMPSSCE